MHGNDLFLHWREEVGRPSAGSVDEMFGADIAAGYVYDFVMDGETGSVRV